MALRNLSLLQNGKTKIRISRPEVFYKIGVLKSFAKFTGKTPVPDLFFDKVAGLSLQLTKKETLAQVFSCGFCKHFKNTFFNRTPPVVSSVKSP